MSSPCFKCGARPDVACKHRPADPEFVPTHKRKDRGADLGRPAISGGGNYTRLSNGPQKGRGGR